MSNLNTKLKLVDSEDIGTFKMSKVIIDFADELLDRTKNFKQSKGAIMIAVAAWNIAALNDDNQKADMINMLLDTLKESKDINQAKKDMIDILNYLIERKQKFYSDINRVIMHYELIPIGKEDFHLHIASSLV